MFTSCFGHNDFIDEFLRFGDAGGDFDQVCVYRCADLPSLSSNSHISQFVEGGDEVGEELGEERDVHEVAGEEFLLLVLRRGSVDDEGVGGLQTIHVARVDGLHPEEGGADLGGEFLCYEGPVG